MAKVNRFFWVWSTRSTTRHMASALTEGYARCGRAVTIGWQWARRGSAPRKLPRCKGCQRAA